MANGLQIAASGLMAQQTRLDTIANDIANVNTAGYKPVRVSFAELTDGGVRVAATASSSRQGPLVGSDAPLAVALEGPGYLQVRSHDGKVALTRGGELRLDGGRTLVLPGGERLQPPVTVPAGTSPADVAIAADGTVSVAGRKLGRLEIVTVPSPSRLADLGGGLLAATAASGAATPARSTAVRQGYLEGSGVDVADAVVQMVETQRAFELASRAVHTQDQLLEIANGIRR